MAAAKAKEDYSFSIIRNYPCYHSFEILRHPDASFFKAFLGTFSQLFKGE
jgi:hypothetical protein